MGQEVTAKTLDAVIEGKRVEGVRQRMRWVDITDSLDMNLSNSREIEGGDREA